MSNLFKKYILFAPIVFFFVIYLLWLFRAYHDVAYLDTIQILAGNINNMYNGDASLQDYYYRPPFLFLISTIITYVNCKLFAYNSFYENIISGSLLLFIGFYFFKFNNLSFTKKARFYFSVLVGLIVFSLTKWEMSLWGGGFSHYMVVAFGFVCLNIAHRFYIVQEGGSYRGQNSLVLYIVLSSISILEATAYFLPFQLSLLLVMLVNYFLFEEKVDVKRFVIAFSVTIGLLAFSFLVNYLAELYSIQHPYEVYGKVNLSNNIGAAVEKLTKEPMFVVKFFLIANAGNLIDKDSYSIDSFGHNVMPFAGLLVLLFYVYAIYSFIKTRKIEGTVAINLILCTIIFYGTVLMGRLHFNDVYYGASSRYSAATFTGVLGLATYFMIMLDDIKEKNKIVKYSFVIPILFIICCTLITYKNQWQIAPYRKEAYLKMEQNLKANKNLESLMGYNDVISGKAREMMIRNKLNVFKPKTKLNNFDVNKDSFKGISGFYDLEQSEGGSYRWTNGKGIVDLPNLYTSGDSIKVKLKCYVPLVDTPSVILNGKFLPYQIEKQSDGYLFSFSFQEQKVIYKAEIKNRSFKPQELHKDSQDNRTLGLIFHSLTFYN